MSVSRRFLLWVWFVLLAVVAGAAHAFSLGKLRGAAILGQPLELSVGVQMAADEDAGAACITAEVMYGDALVEGSAVSARLVTSEAGAASIIVTVRRSVDEPVVTVYLRSGCRTSVSRKYVLLAEPLSESQPLVKLPQVPAVVAPVNAVDAKAGAADVSPVRQPKSAGTPTPAQGPRRERKAVDNAAMPSSGDSGKSSRPVAVAAAPSAPQRADRKPVAQGGGARLKLTPLELSRDWDPSLRMSMEISAANPTMDEAQRSQAQAVWRAMQATPEDLLQEALQRASLQKELAELTRQSKSNEQSIAEMTVALRKAQDSRMANPALFVLLALLVACGALLAVRARGAGVSPPWWMGRGKDGVDSEFQPSPSMPEGMGAAQSRATHASGAPVTAAAAEDLSTPVANGSPASQPPVSRSGFVSTASGQGTVSSFRPSDFAHSVTGALRSINTQEMLDVRQQAEFFLALGQHGEAIDLLRSALNQSSESNPHIYLDLLDLLHRLGRKDEYENTREAFMSLYSGLVPGFGDYGQPGPDLLDYPAILTPLAGAWPSRYALEFIEQCLVREAHDPAQHGFSMEAFRDLLLLHAMLASIDPPADKLPSRRPPTRELPHPDVPLARSATSTTWGAGVPLDLDLS